MFLLGQNMVKGLYVSRIKFNWQNRVNILHKNVGKIFFKEKSQFLLIIYTYKSYM